jgi:ABC-type Zn uptake system ZnuABC Zn-binding protein ZnuA
MQLKKEFSKNKSVAVSQNGYNEFYLINGKDMSVQNSDLNELKEDAKKGDIKRIFTKSMKSRTVSRVLLSKFIRQVA